MTTTLRQPATARDLFIRRTLAAAPKLSADRRHRIATVLYGQGE